MSPEYNQQHHESIQTVDMFDELVGLLAECDAPDKSEAFFESMRTVFNDVEAVQDIRRLSEMAMTLGAMACLHPHLESISNEMGEKYGQKHSKKDGHDHDDEDTKKSTHDSKKCSNCKNGKHCSHVNISYGLFR